MKRILTVLLLLTVGNSVSAQTMDTVLIVQKARKFNARQHILLMFELLDTVDAFGKNVTLSRSYYFDKKQRMISSVRQYENPRKPERGTQVIYSFAANKLTAVTVIPSKSTCTDCASEYHFSGDTLLTKKEGIYTHADPGIFLRQAQYFQSRLPSSLPWGYFEDEVLVNGKMKKLRHQY